MPWFSSRSSRVTVADGCLGQPGDLASSQGSQQESPVSFLSEYGYTAADTCSWQTSAACSSERPDAPLLTLHVIGHEQRDGHTWYQVDCSLTSGEIQPLNWQVLRRLTQLREDLHDHVKASFGKSYDLHFGKRRFAHIGGPRGTTERLDCWCKSLSDLINVRSCPPTLVCEVLRFVEVPPRLSIPIINTNSADSLAVGKLKDELEGATESAKLRMEQSAADLAAKVLPDSLQDYADIFDQNDTPPQSFSIVSAQGDGQHHSEPQVEAGCEFMMPQFLSAQGYGQNHSDLQVEAVFGWESMMPQDPAADQYEQPSYTDTSKWPLAPPRTSRGTIPQAQSRLQRVAGAFWRLAWDLLKRDRLATFLEH